MYGDIEKPWGVFVGYFGNPMCEDVVRIISVPFLDSSEIIRREYHPIKEWWGNEYLKTFKYSKEAANYIFENQWFSDNTISLQYITKRLEDNFPRASKQEKVQELCDLLVNYKNGKRISDVRSRTVNG